MHTQSKTFQSMTALAYPKVEWKRPVLHQRPSSGIVFPRPQIDRQIKFQQKQQSLQHLTFGQLETFLIQANRGIELLAEPQIAQVIHRAETQRAEEGQILPPHLYVIQNLLKLEQPGVEQLIPRFLGRIQNGIHHLWSNAEATALSPAEHPHRFSVLA